MRYDKKSLTPRFNPLGNPLWIALAGAIGYWAFRRLKDARQAPTPRFGDSRTRAEQAAPMRIDELERRWHSLDKERRQGRIPADLARDPKNIKQTIHTETLSKKG